MTKKEKALRMKVILKELLEKRSYKWNELLDAAVKAHTERYPEESGDVNDLKGRIGSVLSLMEDNKEISVKDNVYSLPMKAKKISDRAEEKQTKEKKTRGRKSAEKVKSGNENVSAALRTAEPVSETASVPVSEIISAPVSAVTPAASDEVSEQSAAAAEKPAPRKRGRKPKAKALPALQSETSSAPEAVEVLPAQTVPVKENSGKSVEKSATKGNFTEKIDTAPVSAVTPAASAADSEESDTATSEKPAPKKRGRKPKANSPALSAPVASAASGQSDMAAEKPAPKKRGRKPKIKAEQIPVSEEKEKTEEKGNTTVETKEIEREVSSSETPAASQTSEVSAPELPEAGKTLKEVSPNAPILEKESEKTPAEKELAAKNAVPEKELGEKRSEKALTVKPEAKVAPVFDMTLLFGKKMSDKNSVNKSGNANVKPSATAPVFSAETVSAETSAPSPAKTSSEKASGVSDSAQSAVRSFEATPSDSTAGSPIPSLSRKPVLPEFAFLGNAGLKNSAEKVSYAKDTRAESSVSSASEKSAERRSPAERRERAEQKGPRSGNAPSENNRSASPRVETSARQTASAQTSQIRPVSASISALATSSQTNPGTASGQTAPVQSKANAARDGRQNRRGRGTAAPAAPATEEETLKSEFLKRLRSLGGDYFEYYSVYLLERYSMKNGRRLEGMKVSGGERDGGIDGEITLTDKFGFRETIYIQAKNWDPSKGKVELWVVGETLLQQFIGAVACRQAKEGVQHSRGIFVTTSHFTPEAKEILERMSDKFVGYDEDDVFEAAKECSFGLRQKDGVWTLDEELLSGGKAFFNLL